MIRIIGGKWKGRKLRTPKGPATRPTPARVREALFDVLGDTVSEGTFYDFFAGSGAVGLEALSRGAPRAVFLETARPAVAALRANIELLGCGERALCVTKRLPGWIESPEFDPVDSNPPVFFLDPPYGQALAEPALLALARRANGLKEALCAAQTEKGEILGEAYGPWRLKKRYPHGDSALWLYEID